MEDKMAYFIDQIGQIYDELYNNGLDKNKYSYFTHGGCYLLAKMVNRYCPSAKIMIDIKSFDHSVVKYNDKLYDINGKVPTEDYNNYKEATDEEIMHMENGFTTGEGISEARIYNALVNEIDLCGFEGFIDVLNEEALEKSKTL